METGNGAVITVYISEAVVQKIRASGYTEKISDFCEELIENAVYNHELMMGTLEDVDK